MLLTIFYVFKKRVAASERYCAAVSENYVHLSKYFEVKQLKIKKTMFIYFWLNYCNNNYHIERIPTAVKNVNQLFHLDREIMEADRAHLFLLSDGTRIDDNE